MTPSEREQFDLEIYTEIGKHRGAITDAADYLRQRDPSRISRLVNPRDTRANNIFGEVMDVLEGFNNKHPELAKAIWTKMTLAANSFIDFGDDEIDPISELRTIADSTAREQLDVNFAISRGLSPVEIEREAYEAFEISRIQYEKARALRNRLENNSGHKK